MTSRVRDQSWRCTTVWPMADRHSSVHQQIPARLPLSKANYCEMLNMLIS